MRPDSALQVRLAADSATNLWLPTASEFFPRLVHVDPDLSAHAATVGHTTKLLLRGAELRYVIVDHLWRHGPKTILEIIEELDYHGFEGAR